MRKTVFTILMCMMCLISFAQSPHKPAVMFSFMNNYVILTESICDAKGYNGTTPLCVFVKCDTKSNTAKIARVEPLKNTETPGYFKSVIQNMIPKYAGVNFDEHDQVDCVSGATYSSRAVKENVKAAYQYFIEKRR